MNDDSIGKVLDKSQTKLIEAVHRGFLYQHLYSVGCLFLAAKANIRSVIVDRDEDVELVADTRTYIQIKTRSAPIMPSDIKGAVLRFQELRIEHEINRAGKANFVIVVNQPPSKKLYSQVTHADWPSDIKLLWPNKDSSHPSPALPPAWSDLNEALEWCVSQAKDLPFSLIAPSSLVWKLAAQVQLACTGRSSNPNHAFNIEKLPKLFEQLLVQLQDFPSPPDPYRPQTGEPPIESDSLVRIICGFSGAGKTSWASEAARHSKATITYYDAGDLPGPALASSLVRELTPRLVDSESNVTRKIFIPGASGLESLATLNAFLKEKAHLPIIVLDNAHKLPANNLLSVIKAASSIRFILLCQPSGELSIIEAQLGIQREILFGWDIETVGKVVSDLGGYCTVLSLNRLIKLTGGVPLYVQSAANLAFSQFEGNLDEFCTSLEELNHSTETAQETILKQVFDFLPPATRDVVAVWSLSDLPLYQSEVSEFITCALGIKEVVVFETLRTLRPTGVIEGYGNDRLKVHDSIRILGRRYLLLMDNNAFFSANKSLKNVLMKSLIERRDTSRFSLFVRTLVNLEEIELLVELAGEEYFHELGLSSEIKSFLIPLSESLDIDPRQRFWALDGLVFDATHNGSIDTASNWLESMKDLLANNQLGTDEKLSYFMKSMVYEGTKGNAEKVRSLIEKASMEVPDKPSYLRVLKYNAAAALMELGDKRASLGILNDLVDEYFDLIGFQFVDMVGVNPPDLISRINEYPEVQEDMKRLATALLICANCSPPSEKANLRIQCVKLYVMAGAHDSFIKTAQDLADDFLEMCEYISAKEVMETHVLPHIEKLGLLNRLFDVRSQYAVILAYCGEYEDADSEIARLKRLIKGQPDHLQIQLDNQCNLINSIRMKSCPTIKFDNL